MSLPEDLDKLPLEARGEDEKERPQPADEPADESIGHADLMEMMHSTIERMGKDGTTRGDLKILTRTLRELRYAFKVFQPYRRRRKVTVFGSARTSPAQPAYQQAVRVWASDGGAWMDGYHRAGGGIMEAGNLEPDAKCLWPEHLVAIRAACQRCDSWRSQVGNDEVLFHSQVDVCEGVQRGSQSAWRFGDVG